MGAVENIITDNLPIWSSAVHSKSSSGRGTSSKRTLYGVKKLRELILDLAVRGLLVPQDPNDEPASVLLEKIAAEKEQLIKDGKIKKQKTSLEYLGREDVYKLPAGWSWTLLGNIVGIIRGVTYRKSDASDAPRQDTKPLLRANNIQRELNFEKLLYIPNNLIKSEQFIKKHDFLIAMSSGSANLVGKSVLVKEDLSMTFGAFCAILRPYKSSVSRYLNNFLSSPVYRLQAQGSGKGIGIQNLNTAALQQILIPIPPDVEQDKIANKVDELMALCDTLEQQQEDSIQAHEVLVEALLEALTDAIDADTFQAAWQRISEHFDVLFTTEHSVKKLKETILQLAIMGKLVPQDPSDEPASVLLKRIAAEKEMLVSQGLLRKQQATRGVGSDNFPFRPPAGWALVRFGELVAIAQQLVQSTDYPQSYQVAPDCIEKGTGKLLVKRTVKQAGVRGPNNKFQKGQVLYSKIRPSLNKVIYADFDGLCSADMYPLNVFINASFLIKVMLSEVFLRQVRKAENRVKMPKLNIESLINIVVAIPPLEEQKCIVSMLDETMIFCDRLKESLQQAQQTQIHLTDAVVESAL